MPPPRRNTLEHLTAARLYPDIRHVYVEGRTDARYVLVSAVFPKACDVHPIEEVEWDLDEEYEDPFLSGYRARVIVLADLFDGRLKGDNARFLVDKDHEDQRPTLPNYPTVIVTDFANVMVGELAFNWVRDAVFTITGAAISPIFWSNLIDACRFLFSYRYVKQANFPQAHQPVVSNFIDVQEGSPLLDSAAYCINGATSPHVHVSAQELMNMVLQDAAAKVGDDRHWVNSSDFLALLRGFIREAGLAANVSQESLKAAVLVSMPKVSADQPRLQLLLQWMTA